jgi:hypothetical protein
MKHDDISVAETTLITLAELDGHLEVAIHLLRHQNYEGAMRAVKLARRCGHQAKLHVVALRWIDAPQTLQQILKDQVSWLAKKWQA